MQQGYNLRLGVLTMILASFGFSAMQLTVALSKTTMPLMQQVFFRNIICLAIGLVLCRVRRVSCFGSKNNSPFCSAAPFRDCLGCICLFAASAERVRPTFCTDCP